MGERAAIRHYVRGGFRTGFVLNPLFAEQLVSMQLSDAGRVPALYAYLVNDRQRVETTLLWDARQYATAHPESDDDPAGPLGHAWRGLRSGASIDFGLEGSRSPAGRDEVTALIVDGIRAAGGRAIDDADVRMTGDVLLWLVADSERDIALTFRTAVAAWRDLEVGIALGIAGSRAETWITAMAMKRSLGATVVPIGATEEKAVLWRRVGADRMMTGSRLTVRGLGDEVTAETVVRLAGEEDADAISPLVLDTDGVLVNAGLVRHHGTLTPLLGKHPVEDARGMGTLVHVDGIASSTFSVRVSAEEPRTAAVRTDTWVIVEGSSRRSLEGNFVGTRAPLTPPIDELLAPLDFRARQDEQLTLERVTRPAQVGTPRLRWALKTAAPAGLGAEWWGDTHFARGLAGALRRLGHDVVIDSIGARDRATHHFDDVELVLRGPEAIKPHTAATSILWIISHPDQITREEVAGFDHVFAASTSWARGAAQALGSVTPLLQCTDVHRFHPTGAENTDRLVFVGTARGIPRPSVIEPIRAGFPVDVIGPDWTGWIPASSVIATTISNADLPALYEGARLVLNDHWPAMQRSGFISNRLFDVVAAGGRAISDEVEGIDEIFHGSVRTYRSVPELLDLLGTEPSEVFPPSERAREISAEIRQRHSFDARAETLERTAAELRLGSAFS